MKPKSFFIRITTFTVLLTFIFTSTSAYSDADANASFVKHSAFNLGIEKFRNSENIPDVLAREGILVPGRFIKNKSDSHQNGGQVEDAKRSELRATSKLEKRQERIREVVDKIWGQEKWAGEPENLETSKEHARRLIKRFKHVPGISSAILELHRADHRLTQFNSVVAELQAADYLEKHVAGAKIIGFRVFVQNQEIDVLLNVRPNLSKQKSGDEIELKPGLYLVEVKSGRKGIGKQLERYRKALLELSNAGVPAEGIMVVKGARVRDQKWAEGRWSKDRNYPYLRLSLPFNLSKNLPKRNIKRPTNSLINAWGAEESKIQKVFHRNFPDFDSSQLKLKINGLSRREKTLDTSKSDPDKRKNVRARTNSIQLSSPDELKDALHDQGLNRTSIERVLADFADVATKGGKGFKTEGLPVNNDGGLYYVRGLKESSPGAAAFWFVRLHRVKQNHFESGLVVKWRLPDEAVWQFQRPAAMSELRVNSHEIDLSADKMLAQMAAELLFENGYEDRAFTLGNVQKLWETRYQFPLFKSRAKKILEMAVKERLIEKDPKDMHQKHFLFSVIGKELYHRNGGAGLDIAKDNRFLRLVDHVHALYDALEFEIDRDTWRRDSQKETEWEWSIRYLAQELDYQFYAGNYELHPLQFLELIYSESKLIETLPYSFPEMKELAESILSLFSELYHPIRKPRATEEKLLVEEFSQTRSIHDAAEQAAALFQQLMQPKYEDGSFVSVQSIQNNWRKKQKSEFKKAEEYFRQLIRQAEKVRNLDAFRESATALQDLLGSIDHMILYGRHGTAKLEAYYHEIVEANHRLLNNRSFEFPDANDFSEGRSELRSESSLSEATEVRSELREIAELSESIVPEPTQQTIAAFEKFSGIQFADKVTQPQILGILTNLGRLQDLRNAIIKSRKGKNKIVVFAGTRSELRLVQDYLDSQKIPREQAIVTQVVNPQAIFGDQKNAKLILTGLPEDETYAFQVTRLLKGYDVVTQIGTVEILESIFNITSALRSELRQRMAALIAA